MNIGSSIQKNEVMFDIYMQVSHKLCQSLGVIYHYEAKSLKIKDIGTHIHQTRSAAANLWIAHVEMSLSDSQKSFPFYFGLITSF